MTKRKWTKWKKYKSFFGAGLLLSLLFMLFFYMNQTLGVQIATATGSINEYEKEYVLIAESKDSYFWQKVYESGLNAAKEQNAYLEWMEQSNSYPMADYIKIAIHAKVDGILICPDNSTEVKEQLVAAKEANIPVITLVEDVPTSGRISSVGLNAYQLGQLYASQILKAINTKTKKVLVLVDEQDSANKDIIFNQIKNTIKNEGNEENLVIETYTIPDGNSFDAEEEVRNIFLKKEQLPEILVCLSDTDTQAAVQAVVDFNQVGNVTILGYDISDTVLNAIQKGIVMATIAPDTVALGKDGINSLVEYKDTGYVSEYTSISLSVVNQTNVKDYVEELDEAK